MMRQPFFDNLDKKDTCIFLYLTGAFAIAFFGTKKCQKLICETKLLSCIGVGFVVWYSS